MSRPEIDGLREEIQKIDSEILHLLARRQETSTEIGLTKRKDDLPVRDANQEERVRNRFSALAKSLGIDDHLAKKLLGMLIADSIRVQKFRTGKPPLKGRKAFVIGGAGRMGEWTCRFFSNRGAEVTVWDDRKRLTGYRNVKAIASDARRSDYVVIASPPGTCGRHLKEVLRSEPDGIVFDLCSVKSHISGILRGGADDGHMVSSAHPMFGPSAPSPKGLNLVVCDCGCDDANDDLDGLFGSAGAIVTHIPLEEHDRLMAYVLGLPHICGLLFASVARESDTCLHDLREVQGPTFEKLLRVASEICSESKRVYHDIQALNPHTKGMLADFERACREVRGAALDPYPTKFGKIMESNREHLGGG